MSYLAMAIRDCAPRAASALGLAGSGLALLVVAAASRRRVTATRYRATVTAGVVAFASAIAVGIVAIVIGRLDLVRATTPGDHMQRDESVIFRDIQLQILGIALVGAVMLLFVVTWAFFILRARGDKRERQDPGAWLLPILAAAAGTLAYGLHLSREIGDLALAPIATRAARFSQSMTGAHFVVDWARRGLAVAVALAAASAIFRWIRAQSPVTVSRWKMVGASFVFASGLAAYTLTRDHATEHGPLPLLTGGAIDASRARELPQVVRCAALAQSAPTLSFEGDQATLDRSPVDPSDFQERIETFRNNYPLLHRGAPLSVLAIVLASPTTPVARVIPYLQRAGAGEIHVAAVVRRDFQSRTLGPLERYEYCGLPFRLTSTGRRMNTHLTWASLSKTLENAGAAPELSPW